MSHNPNTAQVLLPLDLGSGANPTSAPLPCSPRDDALGSSDPSSRAQKQEGQGSVMEQVGAVRRERPFS